MAVGGSSVSRPIKRGSDAVVLGSKVTLLANDRVILVVADGHTDRRRVDVTVTPNQESTEAGLSEEVKDAVENGLRVGRNDVATLAESPGDGVQDPEEGGQRTAIQEGLLHLGTVVGGVLAGLEGEHVDDVKQRDAA